MNKTRHGGKITVVSRHWRVSSASPVNNSSAKADNETKKIFKKVLVVDDNDRFRKTLIEHIRECENADVVDEARDGIEAIAKAATHKPDIILMDLAMPNCNGFEATRAIRALLPSTKIVVMTLNHGVEYHRMALQNGADDSLAKSDLKVRLDDILTIAEKKIKQTEEKKNSVENE